MDRIAGAAIEAINKAALFYQVVVRKPDGPKGGHCHFEVRSMDQNIDVLRSADSRSIDTRYPMRYRIVSSDGKGDTCIVQCSGGSMQLLTNDPHRFDHSLPR